MKKKNNNKLPDIVVDGIKLKRGSRVLVRGCVKGQEPFIGDGVFVYTGKDFITEKEFAKRNKVKKCLKTKRKK